MWQMRKGLKRIGWLPIVLAGLQCALMVVTESSQDTRNVVYGCSALCDSGLQRFVPDIVTAFGVCIFLLPVLIGIFSRTWASAVGLAVLSTWLAVALRSRTLLTPYIGLGQTSGRFDDPFWISSTHLSPIVMSFALFAGLGWLGWLIRGQWRGDDQTAN